MEQFPIRVFDSSTKFYKESRFFRYYRSDINLVSRIKLNILELYFLLINGLVELVRICLFKKLRKDKVKNILIFRTGSIGDNVVALPSINAVRECFPNAKITILTSTGNTSYVSFENIASPELYDSVINYSGSTLISLRSQLKGRYDLIIELPQFINGIAKNIRNMIFFRIYCGISYGFGWQVSNVNLFKNAQEQNILYKNEVSILSSIISKHLKINFEKAYKFKISNEDKNRVNDLLENISPNKLSGFDVLIIGANYVRNRWPLDNFIQMANNSYNLSSKYSLIIGAESDNRFFDEVSLPNNIVNLSGKLTIGQTAYLLSKADEVLSNDTGPMHIAAAFGIKLKAFFSCKDFPGRWFPDLGNSKIYRSFGVTCSICMNKSCQTNFCLSNISVNSF